jgi:carboxylate-amine ligase
MDQVKCLEWQLPLAFDRAPLTVGVEEELLVLDAATLDVAHEAERVLAGFEDGARFMPEFRAAQLEVATPVCATVEQAGRELAAARRALVDSLPGDVQVAAVPTHPFSTAPVEITQRDRYQTVAAEFPWAARRGYPSGLHVHVAVGDGERALAVYNAARSYLPEIAALAASSPFFEGQDTGLASTRLKLTEDLPRSGVPPAFRSWRAVAEFLAWGTGGGLFADPTYLWWDLRLHPGYGTIEFRVADVQTSLADTAAIAAVCHSLTALLASRSQHGDALPVHDSHRIAENRWRALRDGLDAGLVDLDTGEPLRARDRVARLLVAIEPVAESLGCRDALLAAWTLLQTGGGASQQRRVHAQWGLLGLTEWLVKETDRSARAVPSLPRAPEQAGSVPSDPAQRGSAAR